VTADGVEIKVAVEVDVAVECAVEIAVKLLLLLLFSGGNDVSSNHNWFLCTIPQWACKLVWFGCGQRSIHHALFEFVHICF